MKRRVRLLASLLLCLLCLGVNSGSMPQAALSGLEVSSPPPPPASAPAEISMMMPVFKLSGEKDTIPDLPMIEEALNKITVSKLNIKVNLVKTVMSTDQSMLIALSSNKMVDVVLMLSFESFLELGFLTPLDGLLEAYGGGIKAAIGDELLTHGRAEGSQYALATNRDIVSSYGICMRKDILEKYGFSAESIKTLDDFEAVLKAVHEHEPELMGILSFNPGTSVCAADQLGDGVGVLPLQGNADKVINYYATQEFYELAVRLHRWYTLGYIPQNVSEIGHSPFQMIKDGKLFSHSNRLKPGMDSQETKLCGYEMVCVELYPPLMTTLDPYRIQWGITSFCQAPEDAMRLLNLLYTDPEVMNLLCWGIEGTHYVVSDDQTIDYPAGTDALSTGYNFNSGWILPNQFIAHVWKGDPPDLWQQTIDFNNNAEKSGAFGFVFDSSPVSSEYAAVVQVISKYMGGLRHGIFSPDEAVPEFLEKLAEAGIDTVIREKQRQLDAWRSS